MILAFAETFNHDAENSLSVVPIYEDDSEFPPLNPLKEGWQLVDDDNIFSHELVQEIDDWESVTKNSNKPILLSPLYVEIASKGPLDHDPTLMVTASKQTTIEKTFFPARILRRHSTSSACSNSSSENKALASEQGNLDLDLHGQYKSPRRRHRRSMYMNASSMKRQQQHLHYRYRAALRPQLQSVPGVPEQTPSKMKSKHTHRTIKKTTARASKMALVEQGLDWAVCH